MPVTYRIDKATKTVRLTATGETSDDDWKEVASRVMADPDTGPEMNLIYDAREHRSVVSTEFVWGFVSGVKPRTEEGRWAIVISRPVSRGMANMLATLVQSKNIRVETFRNLEDAEAWVASSAPRAE